MSGFESSEIPIHHDGGLDTHLRTLESSPITNYNPLLDVKVPKVLLGSEIQPSDHPNAPSSKLTSFPEKIPPQAVIGPDSYHLEPPSLTTPIFNRVRDRNLLHDIQLPNAVIAPDFGNVSPQITSPLLHSARDFSSLACPPQLPAHEWTAFARELEETAARSEPSKTSFAIAIGITLSDGTFVWGKWHHLRAQEDATSIRGPQWQSETVKGVVERRNGRWMDRDVTIALEVSSSGGNAAA